MNTAFFVITILFVIISVAMILIILVQRPQGGGLAGAFGGAGGAGSDTVFGGRVGDALTWATVVGFIIYLTTAISLNKIESGFTQASATDDTEQSEMIQMDGPPPVDIDSSAEGPGPTAIPSGPPPGFDQGGQQNIEQPLTSPIPPQPESPAENNEGQTQQPPAAEDEPVDQPE